MPGLVVSQRPRSSGVRNLGDGALLSSLSMRKVWAMGTPRPQVDPKDLDILAKDALGRGSRS
jgi:hypothetical protein